MTGLSALIFGASWSAGRTIWPHPASYSGLAVLQDHIIAFIYERGGRGSTHYGDELHFARFDLEWLHLLDMHLEAGHPQIPDRLPSGPAPTK